MRKSFAFWRSWRTSKISTGRFRSHASHALLMSNYRHTWCIRQDSMVLLEDRISCLLICLVAIERLRFSRLSLVGDLDRKVLVGDLVHALKNQGSSMCLLEFNSRTSRHITQIRTQSPHLFPRLKLITFSPRHEQSARGKSTWRSRRTQLCLVAITLHMDHRVSPSHSTTLPWLAPPT